jgi:hypothetical protein
LKATIEKDQTTCKVKPINRNSKTKAGTEWHISSPEKKVTANLDYYICDIHDIHDKQKLKWFMNTKSALQKILK